MYKYPKGKILEKDRANRRKSPLDFGLRISAILFTFGFISLGYLAWGILESTGVLDEIYANHSQYAIQGGALFSLVLFGLAYRYSAAKNHGKPVIVKVGSLVWFAGTALAGLMVLGFAEMTRSANGDWVQILGYSAIILGAASVSWMTRKYRARSVKGKRD